MIYRPLRASLPSPTFELHLRANLKHLVARMPQSPPPSLMPRFCAYLSAILVRHKLPLTVCNVATLVEGFSQLAQLSKEGKPFILVKRNSLSLLFDFNSLQSEMAIEAPDDLVLGYTRTMMGFLLFNSEPRQIGMIGLGGGSLAKYCYRRLPDAAITVAEIDKQIIAFRDYFHMPQDDARLTVRCQDGAELVRLAENRFDVLLIDGFDRNGQPPQLCSQRFYDDCKKALGAGGILVVNLLGSAEAIRTYCDRLRTAFNGAVIVIDALDSMNKIAFACKENLLDWDENTLRQRAAQLESQFAVSLNLTLQRLLLARCKESIPDTPDLSSYF